MPTDVFLEKGTCSAQTSLATLGFHVCSEAQNPQVVLFGSFGSEAVYHQARPRASCAASSFRYSPVKLRRSEIDSELLSKSRAASATAEHSHDLHATTPVCAVEVLATCFCLAVLSQRQGLESTEGAQLMTQLAS